MVVLLLFLFLMVLVVFHVFSSLKMYPTQAIIKPTNLFWAMPIEGRLWPSVDDIVDDVGAAECTDGRPSLLPTDDHGGAASTSLFVIIGDDRDVETICYISSLSDDHRGVELCLSL